MALLEPGDTFLGLALDHGGHLSHGMKINVSGTLYNPVALPRPPRGSSASTWTRSSGSREEHKPALIVAGWSAYPRQLDFAAFREIADSVGAKLMVDMAHFAGLVAAGEHPNPVEHADVVTTTIHKTLCGPRSGMILCREEHAKAIDKAVFPGQQGGPLMHTVAAKAVALPDRRQRAVPRSASGRRSPTPRPSPPASKPAASRSSPAAPTSTSSSSTSPRPASTARPRRTASTRSGSPSTATRSPSTRGRR